MSAFSGYSLIYLTKRDIGDWSLANGVLELTFTNYQLPITYSPITLC
ncbi:MAG: hypothetical protein AAF208_01600 [Cyanobacteria bacterium P01_A01_bin.45]